MPLGSCAGMRTCDETAGWRFAGRWVVRVAIGSPVPVGEGADASGTKWGGRGRCRGPQPEPAAGAQAIALYVFKPPLVLLCALERVKACKRRLTPPPAHAMPLRVRRVGGRLATADRLGAPNHAGRANRVNRGGDWNNDARNLREALQFNNTPGNRNNNLGFRLSSSRPRPDARPPRRTRPRPSRPAPASLRAGPGRTAHPGGTSA
jgi:hypothetical protein